MNRSVIHIVFIALLGLLAYSNTFHAPFQWDDKYSFLAENPIVKDLSYFIEPSKAKEHELYSAFKGRYIGYLTFALNYKLHGFDVTGYHVFNITIHILNALLVYFLVILTFRTPFLGNSSLKEHSKYIALFTGLLFVSHPVQTEAVTYIFQRLASFAAFFYLLSLTAYIGSRLSTTNAQRYALYALSFVSAVLAMKTKENAFTLPFAIMLYEFLFFKGPVKPRLLRLIPLLLTLFIIPVTIVGIDKPVGEIISQIKPATEGHQAILRKGYFLTQFRVIVTYIRLLFLPINQNVDYDYPYFNSFFNPQVYLSFLFLLSIFGFAVYLFWRSFSGNLESRLISVGVFWFFLTLSVESSIIPLPTVINEYRLYLPSVGAFLAITTGASLLLKKLRNRKVKVFAVSSLILIPLVFSYATYARNALWGDEASLWEDVMKKSPRKVRGYYNLGLGYMYKGMPDKAIEQYRIAIKMEPYNADAHNNLGNAYRSKGLIDRAIEQYEKAVKIKPNLAEAHYNLGSIYGDRGLVDKAIEHSEIAVKLRPADAKAHNNLGTAYWYKGMIDRAIEHYRTAVRLKPDFAEAHNNLGNAYDSKGLTDKAIEHYRITLRLNPGHAKANNNLGTAYWHKGLIDKAIEHYRAAIGLKPDFAKAYNNLGNAYDSKGLTDKAIEHYLTALRLKPDFAEAHGNLGNAYLKKGLPDKAEEHFQKAGKLKSN